MQWHKPTFPTLWKVEAGELQVQLGLLCDLGRPCLKMQNKKGVGFLLIEKALGSICSAANNFLKCNLTNISILVDCRET